MHLSTVVSGDEVGIRKIGFPGPDGGFHVLFRYVPPLGLLVYAYTS